MDSNTELLKMCDLRIEFETFEGIATVLDGVSLTLDRGDTLGLVGETGCGKSITAKAILGLLPIPPTRITAGKVLFHQQNLLQTPESKLQTIRGSKIAMIFQDPMTYLNPVFSVRKQMVDVILGHAKRQGRNLSAREAERKAIELLKAVQIPNAEIRIKDYPHEFSGGMRQRVLIAMALSGEPELLIADEPTTALDVTIQAQILRLIRQLVEKYHLSVLLISHDMGVVASLCRRIAVMYAGNIVELTTTERIFTFPSHPYTIGLLQSIPDLYGRKKSLTGIKGSIPDFIHSPEGCRFHPRCAQMMSVCRKVKPVLATIDRKHQAACFLYETSFAT
ncbi:MAG: ABC transporter ATP-binding protein [Deltaproteobacteria bacterium]|nr:ABC transporter ATP-binding protein [Deltaproteobacteria bacterium]